MDRQSKDPIANEDGEELELFVRSSPRELDSGELDRVAGGRRDLIVPWG
ncbi:MAG TPA: hypothetical protein VIT38_05045 [Allosphingosinicella sp.]